MSEKETKELVIYVRTGYCPYVALAREVLTGRNVPHREINISDDLEAERRVLEWTGYKSVPTLVIANRGEDVP